MGSVAIIELRGSGGGVGLKEEGIGLGEETEEDLDVRRNGRWSSSSSGWSRLSGKASESYCCSSGCDDDDDGREKDGRDGRKKDVEGLMPGR